MRKNALFTGTAGVQTDAFGNPVQPMGGAFGAPQPQGGEQQGGGGGGSGGFSGMQPGKPIVHAGPVARPDPLDEFYRNQPGARAAAAQAARDPFGTNPAPFGRDAAGNFVNGATPAAVPASPENNDNGAAFMGKDPFLWHGGTVPPGQSAIVGDKPNGSPGPNAEVVTAVPGGGFTVTPNPKNVGKLPRFAGGTDGAFGASLLGMGAPYSPAIDDPNSPENAAAFAAPPAPLAIPYNFSGQGGVPFSSSDVSHKNYINSPSIGGPKWDLVDQNPDHGANAQEMANQTAQALRDNPPRRRSAPVVVSDVPPMNSGTVDWDTNSPVSPPPRTQPRITPPPVAPPAANQGFIDQQNAIAHPPGMFDWLTQPVGQAIKTFGDRWQGIPADGQSFDPAADVGNERKNAAARAAFAQKSGQKPDAGGMWPSPPPL